MKHVKSMSANLTKPNINIENRSVYLKWLAAQVYSQKTCKLLASWDDKNKLCDSSTLILNVTSEFFNNCLNLLSKNQLKALQYILKILEISLFPLEQELTTKRVY